MLSNLRGRSRWILDAPPAAFPGGGDAAGAGAGAGAGATPGRARGLRLLAALAARPPRAAEALELALHYAVGGADAAEAAEAVNTADNAGVTPLMLACGYSFRAPQPQPQPRGGAEAGAAAGAGAGAGAGTEASDALARQAGAALERTLDNLVEALLL